MGVMQVRGGDSRVCVRTRVDAPLILPERGDAMGKFLDYNPDQAYLLPPSVRDVLGEGHLCFFLRRVVAKLNLNAFRDEYGVEEIGRASWRERGRVGGVGG